MKMKSIKELVGTFRLTLKDALRLSIAIGMCTILGFSGGAPSWGGPPDTQAEQRSTTTLIREAARAADQAWEEFHRAAIGGTLASPATQTHIEHQLHEVRSLLMEARQAERDNQVESVKTLTKRIFDITDIIIQSSRERKS